MSDLAKFLTNRSPVEWNPVTGECSYLDLRREPCPGPVWSTKGCVGRYEDEYGTDHYCPNCTYGNGTREYFVRIPVPEFNAPRPPKGWTKNDIQGVAE